MAVFDIESYAKYSSRTAVEGEFRVQIDPAWSAVTILFRQGFGAAEVHRDGLVPGEKHLVVISREEAIGARVAVAVRHAGAVLAPTEFEARAVFVGEDPASFMVEGGWSRPWGRELGPFQPGVEAWLVVAPKGEARWGVEVRGPMTLECGETRVDVDVSALCELRLTRTKVGGAVVEVEWLGSRIDLVQRVVRRSGLGPRSVIAVPSESSRHVHMPAGVCRVSWTVRGKSVGEEVVVLVPEGDRSVELY